MSFYDRHTSIIIGIHPGLAGAIGPTSAADEIFTPGEEGWDTLVIPYIYRAADLTPEDCAVEYPQGAQLGTRKFWIVNAVPRRATAGLWIVEVTYKGWAAEKPVKVRIGSAAEQQRGEDVTIGLATYPKAQVQQNTPTITLVYLVEDAQDPAVEMTSSVGTAVTPPIDIEPPENTWPDLSDPLYHFPNGWVLMGSDQDRLPGTTAALVSDTYKYIQPISPG